MIYKVCRHLTLENHGKLGKIFGKKKHHRLIPINTLDITFKVIKSIRKIMSFIMHPKIIFKDRNHTCRKHKRNSMKTAIPHQNAVGPQCLLVIGVSYTTVSGTVS